MFLRTVMMVESPLQEDNHRTKVILIIRQPVKTIPTNDDIFLLQELEMVNIHPQKLLPGRTKYMSYHIKIFVQAMVKDILQVELPKEVILIRPIVKPVLNVSTGDDPVQWTQERAHHTRRAACSSTLNEVRRM